MKAYLVPPVLREEDLRNLLAQRTEADRDENKQIELYSNGAISLDKFLERKKIRDERLQSIDAVMQEIDARCSARSKIINDMKTATEICKAVQNGIVYVTDDLSFEEKRELLEALHVKATAK